MAQITKRYSGVLAHPTSFPSPYGIGDFGKGAYDFISFLTAAGQSVWQILPLGPTGFGDSPYQAFSAFAGQPLLISPDFLVRDGYLSGEDLKDYPQFDPNHIYYGDVIPAKTRVLHLSYRHFLTRGTEEQKKAFSRFCDEEAYWLDDYALFMAAKDEHDGASWLEWDDEIRDPDEEIKERWKQKLFENFNYYRYIQYLFFGQWKALKQFANINGITVVGDIPIFVSPDSADVWAHRELFQLEKDGYPTVVAGVPPDYFSATGQLWGNPLYDWDYHKKTGYAWWISRIQSQLRLVDKLRIDHFRGFEKYYAIPYGEKNAMHGHWRKGPGADLFRALQAALGKEIPIWAEDLGIITPKVEALRDEFGFPGMKVLQFAFSNPKDNGLMPYRFSTEHCICYTGTHDNDTTLGWYMNLSPKAQDRVRRYLNTDGRIISWDMIRLAMSTTAEYSIYPIQDLLGFGSDCRMNTPGVPAGNWAFRFRADHLNRGMAENLRRMTELFGRLPGKEAGDEAETGKETTGESPEGTDAKKSGPSYDPYDPELIEEPWYREEDIVFGDEDDGETSGPAGKEDGQ